MQNCSTFSNWCTRKMPHVSRPCDPASFRKHVETPAYRSGSSLSWSHSPLWYLRRGPLDDSAPSADGRRSPRRVRRDPGSARVRRGPAAAPPPLPRGVAGRADGLLRRRDEVALLVAADDFIQRLVELRELRDAAHDLLVHHERRLHDLVLALP